MKIKNTDTEAQHPWPEGCLVQGGKSGVVFSGNDTYRTAFVEAFPDTFIRGEGKTVEEAEDAAWAQYQRRIACPGHEWEARNYKNGAGFCKHCGTFGSKVFTPEQLGCFCKTCGIPTFWSRSNDDFFCKEHAQPRNSEWFQEQRDDGELNTTGSEIGDLLGFLDARIREEEG